MTLRKFSLQLV